MATDSETRMWTMLCHLAGFAGYVAPFGNILGPLIIWQIKKAEIPSLEEHAKEAMNFQISMTIYTIISAVLVLVLVGFLMLLAVAIIQVVFTIVAAIKANEGKFYRYPLTLRLIR